MKFTSNLLILLSATSILSSTVPDNAKLAINKINYEENPECIKSLESYDECLFKQITELKKKDYDTVCKTYNSDKCQKFYKEGIAGIPACEQLNEVITFQNQITIDKADYQFQRYCSKDENDKYCPLSGYEFKEKDSKEEFDKAVNETCKSRKCLDTSIEYFNKEINLINKINEFQSKVKNNNSKRQFDSSNLKDEEKTNAIVEFLESDKCSSQSPKSEATDIKSKEISTNDSSSLKYSNTLLIIFALYLYYLI